MEYDLDLIAPSEDGETGTTVYTTLHPGQSAQAIHSSACIPLHIFHRPVSIMHLTVTRAYDFSVSGPGTYTLKIKAPVTLYYASKARMLAFSPDVTSEPLVVEISGTVATRAQIHDDDTIPCNQWEMQELRRSIIVAKNYTSTALTYAFLSATRLRVHLIISSRSGHYRKGGTPAHSTNGGSAAPTTRGST